MSHKTHIFLRNGIRKEVKELFVSVWIQNFAIMLLALFIPIYLWKLGYTFFDIAFYFLVVYGAYFFLVPLGAKLAAKIGYVHTIALAMPVTVLFNITLYAVSVWHGYFLISAVVYALAKALYWPAYHADFAQFGSEPQRGREISILYVVGQLTIFGAPLAAGLVLHELSFGWLFAIGSILLMVAIIPLFISKEKVYAHNIPFMKFYEVYFDPKNFRRFVTYLGLGEELVAMTAWPIFMYLVVGDILTFGGVLTGAMLVSSLLLLATGKLTDKFEKSRVVQGTTLFYFLSWIPKLFIATPFGAFVADSFGEFTKTANMIPFTAIVYEEARYDYNGKPIVGAVMFELGYIVSKILSALIMMLIATFTNDLRLILLAGATLSLFFLFIREMKLKRH